MTANSGSVSAFAIDRATGDLRPLNVVSSHGAGPTHMSIDASGKYAFVANYFGGSIAVLSNSAERKPWAGGIHASGSRLAGKHECDRCASGQLCDQRT